MWTGFEHIHMSLISECTILLCSSPYLEIYLTFMIGVSFPCLLLWMDAQPVTWEIKQNYKDTFSLSEIKSHCLTFKVTTTSGFMRHLFHLELHQRVTFHNLKSRNIKNVGMSHGKKAARISQQCGITKFMKKEVSDQSSQQVFSLLYVSSGKLPAHTAQSRILC